MPVTEPLPDLEERFDGLLVKVLAVEADGATFVVRFLNGVISRLEFAGAVELERGDVVVFSDTGWRAVPGEAWPDESRVGVVLKVLDDSIVVDGPVGIQVLRRKAPFEVKVGNTVKFDDINGVQKLVSDTPLRPRDGNLDETLADYRVESDGGDLQGFSSFGGYESVVARARELIETQLERRDELNAIGAPAVKGVIFTGPPGTGKTHLARAIAAEASAAFYLVSGPSIVSKYVGDSEETLRKLFEAAAKDDRAIIFFDEIDSIAAKRSGDTQGDSKRLVAQLLTLLDGFEASSSIMVIAATNRVEDIDEALLRPGRFDWEIQFGYPDLHDRTEILRVRARSLATERDLPLDAIAALTDGWSGAELSAIWTEAALLAAQDGRRTLSDEDLAVAFERVASRPARGRSEKNS